MECTTKHLLVSDKPNLCHVTEQCMLNLFLGVCAAVQLVTKPSGSTFLTGTNLQLRCRCFMYPAGTYAFMKDGSAVTRDSRITIDRHKLFINNATEMDSGTYSCSATSADSSVTQKSTEDMTISVVGKFTS